MQITRDHVEALSKHLRTPQGEYPPAPVYWVLVSLINPDDIKASARSVTLEGVEATVWRVHLVTTKALAVVEVRFEADRYTRDAEQRNRGTRTPTPDFSVKKAWVRPLNKIVAYEVARSQLVSEGDWFPVSASVRFRDLDDPVELPAQALVDIDEERERSDEFLRVLREAIPW
jgi:hypothetical protein